MMEEECFASQIPKMLILQFVTIENLTEMKLSEVIDNQQNMIWRKNLNNDGRIMFRKLDLENADS
jgi:hypothetical protein